MYDLLVLGTIEIGKAVAKQIFKFWVRDSSLGEDITSNIIDLVGSKTADALTQRKGSRQFEEIGDKISENLLTVLEGENISLDEGECKAVAYGVAETLNKSRVTREILLQQNLQPTELESFLRASNPNATRDFGMAGTALYERLLKDASVYIVDISSGLPSFTERTFGEVLKRQDLILDKVDKILEDLHKLRAFLDPMNAADRFEIEYREAVARKLDLLQLIGADVSVPNRRHRLSVAYIMLSVAQKTPFPVLSSARISEEELLDEEVEKVTVSADTALSSSQRLLIKGPAGSGKTTLLQWIAVRAATKSFEGALTQWNEYIPFYIRLRHYAQSSLPKPEDFPEFAAPLIIGTMPKGWVHTVLRSGKAIILVDGVDELSAAQREETHTWLKELTATYPNCRFIITSRPHAIEDGWMNQEAFSEAVLQEMTLEDMDLFIDHWHEAVKQELMTEEEKQELEPLAEHLKTYIKQVRAIRNLATSPLLCAMLCAINRDRRRQLPVNRIELYRACCSLLLERREKESRIDLSDYPALNYDQKIRLLSDLAYWMSKENMTEAKVFQVDGSFTNRLANMPTLSSGTTGQAVRRFMVERSGIIRELALGQIDFAHRTFQEFFAAQAAIDSMDIEYLVAHAEQDQWREVVILAAGLAAQIQCEQLIKGLIERGDREKEHRHLLHLLAISCLETTVELNAELRGELEKRLGQLVPPKNLTEAKALAVAGELVVKYLDKRQLEKKKKLSAPICIACIRTLSIIGGEAALDVLEGYNLDTRETVISEVVKDWEIFDNRKLYAERFLSPILRNSSYLRLDRVSSLEGLHGLPALTTLNLSYCTQLTDLTPLATLSSLTTLDLSDCTQLTDLTPLAALSSLTTLYLINCPQLTDLTSLTKLLVNLNVHR
jgi:NACHT domain/Leucine Rich repeats (2 copies)